MCGIVAELGSSDSTAGRRMLRRLIHRGPDGEGDVTVGTSWLGHRRLAIVDLDGGAQPLRSEDGELWLVGNGEIYNHAEVRAEIGPRGFATRSDNEAALRVDPKHRTARRARDALRERLRPGIGALYEAGKRYFQDEDLHNALRVWRNVLLIDPQDVRTRENVERAERLLARLEEIQTDATR